MKKRMVIIGASRGLGRATAEYFSEKDFEVIRVSRTEGDFIGDIQDPDFRTQLLEQLTPDILINNAGIYPSQHSQFESININLNAIMDLTSGFLKKMRIGIIINVSSLSAVCPPISTMDDIAYSVAKRALSDYTTKIQLTNRSPVKVMLIEPGMFATDFANINRRFKENRKSDAIFKKGLVPISPNYFPEVIDWMISQPANVCIGNVRIMNTYENPP